MAEVRAALALSGLCQTGQLGQQRGHQQGAQPRRTASPPSTMACHYDRKILVEEAVAPCPRDRSQRAWATMQPIASVPGEIVPGHEFYDYAAKYLDDTSQLLIPANLTDEADARPCKRMAVQAFQAIDGSGLARVDFLLDDEQRRLLSQRNQYHARFHPHQHVSQAVGSQRHPAIPNWWTGCVQLALERHADRQQNRTDPRGDRRHRHESASLSQIRPAAAAPVAAPAARPRADTTRTASAQTAVSPQLAGRAANEPWPAGCAGSRGSSPGCPCAGRHRRLATAHRSARCRPAHALALQQSC